MERLVREGKAEDALKKMQSLAMEMDQMLDSLEKAEQEADSQANPELAARFQEFQSNLEKTARAQDALAQATQGLQDKYRKAQADRMKRRGAAAQSGLEKKLAELKAAWSRANPADVGNRFEVERLKALQSLAQLERLLDASDYDLALDTARSLEQSALTLGELAATQAQRDEAFQNPASVRKASRQLAEDMAGASRTADEVRKALEGIFPPASDVMSPADLRTLSEHAGKQRALEKDARKLAEQLEGIQEMAPVFDAASGGRLNDIGKQMAEAAGALGQRQVPQGAAAQRAAAEGLKSLQQQLRDAQKNRGGRSGLPLPLGSGGGRGSGGPMQQDKVEIPEEDVNAASRRLRQEILDAMKQNAPERYREQVKRYYESLVR